MQTFVLVIFQELSFWHKKRHPENKKFKSLIITHLTQNSLVALWCFFTGHETWQYLGSCWELRAEHGISVASGRYFVQAMLLCCASPTCKMLWIILYWLDVKSKDFVCTGKSKTNTVGVAYYHETKNKMSLAHLLICIPLTYSFKLKTQLYFPTSYQITTEGSMISCRQTTWGQILPLIWWFNVSVSSFFHPQNGENPNTVFFIGKRINKPICG